MGAGVCVAAHGKEKGGGGMHGGRRVTTAPAGHSFCVAKQGNVSIGARGGEMLDKFWETYSLGVQADQTKLGLEGVLSTVHTSTYATCSHSNPIQESEACSSTSNKSSCCARIVRTSPSAAIPSRFLPTSTAFGCFVLGRYRCNRHPVSTHYFPLQSTIKWSRRLYIPS